MNCCICNKEIFEHGNSPHPIKGDVCCDVCNLDIVVPYRLFKTIKNNALNISTNKTLEIIKPQGDKFTLKELQKGVEGMIERYPIDLPGYLVFVNEEGFLLDLEYNKLANQIFNIDAVGNVMIVPEDLVE
jgi:hypothetical protein